MGMYSVYYNRTTPFLAFLEGLVRSYDWAAVLKLVKGRERVKPEDESRTAADKDLWSQRIVTWYIRDAIASFEAEETAKLAGDAMLYRCRCAVANVMLGPMPTRDIILRYERVVPGAGDRIMDRASERLDSDGDAEVELLKQRGRQGYMGMAAGFALMMLITGGASWLILTGNVWSGFAVLGINGALVAAASIYVSVARVREKFFRRDFFPGKGARFI